MARWLVKSEPGTYSIDDLRGEQMTLWEGVRNYQARNFLKDMRVGDEVLFYHSSCGECGVVGLARVRRKAEPDASQFDRKSDYFDARATKEKPLWYAPMLEFVAAFKQPVSLAVLKKERALKDMALLQRGSRLSVHPVTDKQFGAIVSLAENGALKQDQ